MYMYIGTGPEVDRRCTCTVGYSGVIVKPASFVLKTIVFMRRTLAKCASEITRFGKGGGLFGRLYRGTEQARMRPTAGLIISTGVHQHAGMYDEFAKRMSSEGLNVLAYDHRGFGQSESYDGLSRSQIPEAMPKLRASYTSATAYSDMYHTRSG